MGGPTAPLTGARVRRRRQGGNGGRGPHPRRRGAPASAVQGGGHPAGGGASFLPSGIGQGQGQRSLSSPRYRGCERSSEMRTQVTWVEGDGVRPLDLCDGDALAKQSQSPCRACGLSPLAGQRAERWKSHSPWDPEGHPPRVPVSQRGLPGREGPQDGGRGRWPRRARGRDGSSASAPEAEGPLLLGQTPAPRWGQGGAWPCPAPGPARPGCGESHAAASRAAGPARMLADPCSRGFLWLPIEREETEPPRALGVTTCVASGKSRRFPEPGCPHLCSGRRDGPAGDSCPLNSVWALNRDWTWISHPRRVPASPAASAHGVRPGC